MRLVERKKVIAYYDFVSVDLAGAIAKSDIITIRNYKFRIAGFRIAGGCAGLIVPHRNYIAFGNCIRCCKKNGHRCWWPF
jgi:hypothetical protein